MFKMEGKEVSPEVFKEEALEYLYNHYDYIWTLKAHTSKGFIPVGFLYGIECGNFIHIPEAEWLPWCSLRNKLETILKFVSINRKNRIYTYQGDQKFSKRLCEYGMLHYVGKFRDIEEPFYQTRLKHGTIRQN